MADESTIIGGRELAEFLQQLPVKVEKNIMRSALRAGVAVFRDELKAKAPVKSGALRRSIRVSTTTKKGFVLARVRVGGKVAPHAHLVEFGTKPHKIEPRNGQGLTVGSQVVSGVDHPGAEPNPFVRPTFDSQSTASIEAVGRKVRERLTNEGLNAPAPEVP